MSGLRYYLKENFQYTFKAFLLPPENVFKKYRNVTLDYITCGNLRKVHVVLYNFGNVAQSGFMKENYLSI